jgi:hypothetical protein
MIGPDIADVASLRERDLGAEWLLHEHDGRLDASAENVAAAAAFALERWRERAAELGLDDPQDLSGACKFCALFAKALFGGVVDGNFEHVFVRVDGGIVDLSAASADVAAMDEPYASDPDHLEVEDLHYSFGTCLRRVRSWLEAYQVPTASVPAPMSTIR